MSIYDVCSLPSQFPGGDNESSEVHLGRMLQILREFPDDPILSAYVIDDVWDDMKAMKVYSPKTHFSLIVIYEKFKFDEMLCMLTLVQQSHIFVALLHFIYMFLQDWKCIISMLLDENPMIELTDVDATNLVRLLHASSRKAVGEKIVPATDNRKQNYTKAQKVLLFMFCIR